MFLPADDGMNGFELWVTDGTPDGTVLLLDINPGSESSWPQNFAVVGDRLFFDADDGTHDRELWVTDGTPEGTVLVKDICPIWWKGPIASPSSATGSSSGPMTVRTAGSFG